MKEKIKQILILGTINTLLFIAIFSLVSVLLLIDFPVPEGSVVLRTIDLILSLISYVTLALCVIIICGFIPKSITAFIKKHNHIASYFVWSGWTYFCIILLTELTDLNNTFDITDAYSWSLFKHTISKIAVVGFVASWLLAAIRWKDYVFAVVLSPLFAILLLGAVIIYDDGCLDSGYCPEGTELKSCTVCGESCTITRQNCPLIGGKWFPDSRECYIKHIYEDKDTCISLGGIWNDKEEDYYFKCDFTEHCKAKIKGKK